MESSAKTVIAIDAMGGDHGPSVVIAGIARALRRRPDLRFLLHGDEGVIAPLLTRRAEVAAACTVQHADDTVAMEDRPATAIRSRRQSSMWLALKSVAAGDARVAVSAGNTGALLAMSVLLLRKAPGVDRPAIAVHWPAAAPHGFNTVLDMGADVRADPRNLLQFAVMGAAYARLSFGLDQPRIGLLNMGTEETKGPRSVREAAPLIAAAAALPDARFSYEGFIEGNDIPGARADVIVTDGFTGNVALKAAEGTATFIGQGLRKAFRHTWLSRLASLFAVTSLRRLSRRIDPRRVNGGVFLGLNGSVVKSHGGADAVGFDAALRLAADMAEADFSTDLVRQLANLPGAADHAVPVEDADQSGAGER
ncbi:MAG: phosphate acyltransferase PlsX [Pseudomonadota bacterium]